MTGIYGIFQKDALDFLREMEDNSVAFTFYDPPYNVGKKYDGYDDNLSPSAYWDLMVQVAREARRVSSRGFGVYVGSKLTKMFYDLLPDAHLIPVHKRAAGVFSGNYMLQYHSLFVVGTPVIKCMDLWNDVRLPGEGYFFLEERFAEHPGQTSLQMTKKVLHHFTEPGDWVADPFMGVGTTSVAALSMGRNFTGSEQSEKYFRVAVNRTLEEYSNPNKVGYVPTEEGKVSLTPGQKDALGKLDFEQWRSAHVLGIPIPTLDSLVNRGLAEKQEGIDITRANRRKQTRYRRIQDAK